MPLTLQCCQQEHQTSARTLRRHLSPRRVLWKHRPNSKGARNSAIARMARWQKSATRANALLTASMTGRNLATATRTLISGDRSEACSMHSVSGIGFPPAGFGGFPGGFAPLLRGQMGGTRLASLAAEFGGRG